MLPLNRFWQSNFARQTGFLFAVDMLANAIDYGFHIFLGRALVPGEFAVFQATNASLLILVASFGVLQPVLARQVAEVRAGLSAPSSLDPESSGLFRSYLRWSLIAGTILAALAAAMRSPLGERLNLPGFAILMGALAIFFILLRPVIAGTLQGAMRFVPFGAVRLSFATGRFLIAALLLGLGWGLRGALAALPAGQLLAVAAGLLFLGRAAWRGGLRPPRERLYDGLKLSGAAFLAYAGHTTLLNLDLLWANRNFTPDAAGAYATAVLLRRVLLLLPGAATVILYPRVAAAVSRRTLPDRFLVWAIALVAVAVSGLTIVYFAAGDWIIMVAFGPAYAGAGALLGPMGLAILGFSLATVWLNLFLATRPWPFVLLLWVGAIIQALLLALWGQTSEGVVAAFSLSGWLLGAGGGLIYVFWLRPDLERHAHGG